MNPFHVLVRIHQGVASRFRNVGYRLLGVQMHGYVWLQRVSIPRNWSDILIEKGTSLDDGVVLLCSGLTKPGKITIREGTYINRQTMLDAHELIEIGRNCMIGPTVISPMPIMESKPAGQSPGSPWNRSRSFSRMACGWGRG
jgi:hypothetical protein